MDIIQLYQDFGIDYVTEGHKHARPGWVNTPCPWCEGNEGYHLGYEIDTDHYYCWRCGWHAIVPTVSRLIGLSPTRTRDVVKQYENATSFVTTVESDKPLKNDYRRPSGIMSLNERHRRYLQKRNFDDVMLERVWSIVGTGPVSMLDNISYNHRIVAPIFWDGQEVSFQARDVTGKDPLRYRACPKHREIIHHKSIVYGRQEKWNDTGICCEGITDTWRLGVHAVCTFGINYTPDQLRVLARAFKRVAVAFDDDPQAVVQANRLVSELKFRNVDAWRVPIVGDPGSMSQKDADYLVQQIVR